MECSSSNAFENTENEDPEMLEQFQANDFIDQARFRENINVLKTPNRYSEPLIDLSDIRSSEAPHDPSPYLASTDGNVIMIRKANSGRMSPVMGMSVRDYEEKMKILRQENFDLRLYSYNLEQKLKEETRSQSELSIKKYTVQLETELAKLQQQLAEKNDLMKSASLAIESLKLEKDCAQRDFSLANEQLAELRCRTTALEAERDASRRELEEARYKLAEAQLSLELPPAKPMSVENEHIANEEGGSMLRNKLAEAETRVSELTHQLSQYEDDHLVSAENSKVRELEHELDSLNQKYERSVKAIQSFIRKLSKRDKEISRLHQKIDELTDRSELKPLPSEEQSSVRVSPRKQCCCQATQHPPCDQQHESPEAAHLLQQVQALETSLCEEKAEKASRLSAAAKEKSRLSEEIKTLNKSLDNMKRGEVEHLTRLNAEMDSVRDENRELKEKLRTAEEEMADLKRRLTEAEHRQSAATNLGGLIEDADPVSLLDDAKALRQSLTLHEDETDRLRSRVRRLQTLLDERTGALTMAHSEAAAQAEAVQEKYRRLVEGLETRLEHKEMQLQQLVESLATRDRVLIESLGAEASTAERLCRQLEEKEQQLSDLLDAKSSMTADLTAARRELARRAEAEKQASRKSLQAAQHECARLQEELTSAEETVQRLQEEVQAAREARRVAEDQSRRQVEERDTVIRKLQASLTDQESQFAALTKDRVGPSPALASFEAMVMEKTARLEESLALREKALEAALHEYRCVTSVLADKEAELDRVREAGSATVAELRAMVHSLESQVEDAEFELSHLRELMHRAEESHVDRLERASMLLEARDRTIDDLLSNTRRASVSLRENTNDSQGAIAIDDLSISRQNASPSAQEAAKEVADMSLSSLHSEVARLRGLLTEKEELLERLGAPRRAVARRLFTLRRELASEAANVDSGSGHGVTTPQLHALHSQIRSLLQTLERTQHLQESFFGDLLATANESLQQQQPTKSSGSPGAESQISTCLATPSRFGDQSRASLSGLSFCLTRRPSGANVTLTTEGVTMTEDMHELIFERLREQVDELRSALATCSEQGLSLMQEAALCASVGQQWFIDNEDWTALLRRLLTRLEQDEAAGQAGEAMHRDIRVAVGLCRQIVDRLDCAMTDDHKESPVEQHSLTASQLRSTYNPKVSGTYSLGSLSPIKLDDSELEPEDLGRTLNLARTRCAALESQLRATRDHVRSLEAENKVLRLRLSGRHLHDGTSGSNTASPENPVSVMKTPSDSGHVDVGTSSHDHFSPVINFSFSRTPFRTPRNVESDTMMQEIVDLERERSALETELSRLRDLCSSAAEDPQRSVLDSRVEEVTAQLRTMRLDLSMRLQDPSCLRDSDPGSRQSGSRRHSLSTARSPNTSLKECEELRQLVVDLRRQLADQGEISELTQRLAVVNRDLEAERERVEELLRERERLVREHAEGREQLRRDLEVAHSSNAQLRLDLSELGEQLRLRESTDSDRLAIEERIVSIRTQMTDLEAENAAVRGRAEQAEAEAERKRTEAARLGRACTDLSEEAECLKRRLTELAEAEAEKSERLAAKAAEEQRLTIALVNAEDEVEGLRRQKEEVERRMTALESSLNAQLERNGQLEEDKARLKSDLEQKESEEEELNEEKTRLNCDLKLVNEERSRLSAALSDMSEEKALLSSELAQVSKERTWLNRELSQACEEKAGLGVQLAELAEERSELTEERKELMARVAALEEEKGASDARYAEVDTRWKLAREELERAETSLATLQEMNSKLGEEVGQLESSLEALRKENAMHETEVSQLKASLENLRRKKEEHVRELQAENSSLKFKVQELQDTLNGWREAMDELEKRLADRSASMDRLSAQYTELSQLREAAEQRSAGLEGELECLRSSRRDWDASEEENRSLHIHKAELERRLQTMTEVLRQREETIEELKAESAEYHRQVQRFSPEIRNLQSNLASVNSHRSEMRACLERLHARIRSSVAEHRARLRARGVDSVLSDIGFDGDDEVAEDMPVLEAPRMEDTLDLSTLESELHRALDQIHSLQDALERVNARMTAKDAALADLAGDLEMARARTAELERAKEHAEELLRKSQSAQKDREALSSAVELRETGEMICALEGRVRDLLTDKEKWKAAAKELRAKLDTRTSRLDACVKQNTRLKSLIKKDEQQAEDRRIDLEKLTMSVEGKNETILRLQRQLKGMQRELEVSRPRAAGHNNSNIHASDHSEASDASEAAPPNDGSFSAGSRSSASSTVTSVQSSRESVRAAAAATPIGPVAPLTPALSDVTGSSSAALGSCRSDSRGERNLTELLSLQAKLRATENLNRTLRAELSLAEQQIESIQRQPTVRNKSGRRTSATNDDSLTSDASMSHDGHDSARLEQFLCTHIEEMRNLRACLEASIAENDQLRQALQQQQQQQQQQEDKKSPSLFEKEFRRLRERLLGKKRRVVELEAELAGVRARTEASERENMVLRSELQATKDLLTACQGELELLSSTKDAGGRREMLRETRRLAVQLERSLASNRRLHDQLKQQLAQRRRHDDFSNCSTPKVTARPGALDDAMAEVSVVAATPSDERARAAKSRLPSVRSISSHRSSESAGSLRVDSDFRLLYAISRLDDYELLRKEVQETLCLVHSIRARIDDRVRHYKSESVQVRGQSLEYSTLKELHSDVSSLVYFLEEENRLIGRFWTTELPPRDPCGHHNNPSSHVQLMETQLEVERLRSSNRLLRQLLDQNEMRLVETDRAKSDMESALVERLSTTEHVLSAARGTLERSTSAMNKTN